MLLCLEVAREVRNLHSVGKCGGGSIAARHFQVSNTCIGQVPGVNLELNPSAVGGEATPWTAPEIIDAPDSESQVWQAGGHGRRGEGRGHGPRGNKG